MNTTYTHLDFDTPPSAIAQWQWEEAVNSLRRQASEEVLSTHWDTTGRSAIDATARAHIGEWAALSLPLRQKPSTIIDALVWEALTTRHWDLYTVESSTSTTMTVRGLRDQRGYEIGWLEGRSPLAPNTLVGLRPVYLDPPGHYVSTLPLVFGDANACADVIKSLLRAFGRAQLGDWSAFMAGPGARILLEFALDHLQWRGAVGGEEFAYPLRRLEMSYARLEAALINRPDEVPAAMSLPAGRFAWIEDVAGGPHLLIFDDRCDRRRYGASLSGASLSGDGVSWCRARRITPEELTDFERHVARRQGLQPDRDGIIRLERRRDDGVFIDPFPEDWRVVEEACLLMSATKVHQAA